MNTSTLKYTPAQRLTSLMNERQMKQVDVLKLIEPLEATLGITLSKSLLSMYVNGKTKPNQKGIYLLATAFNVNEGWLMGYDVAKEKSPNDEFSTLFSQLDETRKARIISLLKNELSDQMS